MHGVECNGVEWSREARSLNILYKTENFFLNGPLNIYGHLVYIKKNIRRQDEWEIKA